MELSEIYAEIKRRVDAVDFSALWRGFSPFKFALYNDSECSFDGRYIEKPSAFMANTSIEYEGEQIAIWNIASGAGDPDELAASIIHEMFHAYQAACGESRYPSELESLKRYRYCAENISLKLREAGLMREIIAHGRKDAYQELLAMRKYRSASYPYEYDYEARVEQIEGTANFVELAALSQIAPDKARARWDRLLERITRPDSYFPVRIISYAVGAAFLACVRGCDVRSFDGFSNQPTAAEVLSGVNSTPVNVENNTDVQNCLESFMRETEEIIARAKEKADIALAGRYPLVSLNIWDARMCGRFAVTNHFVAYRDGCDVRALNGDFVVELDEGDNIIAVYRQ